jgi:hypothetical protein
MDPDEILKTIRERCRVILNSNGKSSDEAYFLAEDIENLDEWLSKTGFVPKVWESAKKKGEL